MTGSVADRDAVDNRVDTDLVVVGAGIGGIYTLIKARELGLDAIALERGGGVGGTWYWNTYPGARCDVESFDYSFSFDRELQQEWTWSYKYAFQPEILAYIEHVVDRYEVRGNIRCDTTVVAADWDEQAGRWTVTAADGARYRARWLVLATGVLSQVKEPELEGLADFAGTVLVPSRWPETTAACEGTRVAIVGTGSTGIQLVPELAEGARHLYVFQRTPSYSLPAYNRPLTEADQTRVKGDYEAFRARARRTPLGAWTDTEDRSALDVLPEERDAEYRRLYDYGSPMRFASAFNDLTVDDAANRTAREFVEARIRERVRDPELAERVIPRGVPVATRRLCIDDGYYESFNRPDVTLVDLTEAPIERVTARGIERAGEVIEVDTIVLATGFDAVTGAIRNIRITGTAPPTLGERWAVSPDSWLGVMVHGFPNLFTVTGPGSPSVTSNMFLAIEQHVEFIATLLDHCARHGITRVEVSAEAQREWSAHTQELGAATLFASTTSWYRGLNVAGKPDALLMYVGGIARYDDILRGIEDDDYPGLLKTAG